MKNIFKKVLNELQDNAQKQEEIIKSNNSKKNEFLHTVKENVENYFYETNFSDFNIEIDNDILAINLYEFAKTLGVTFYKKALIFKFRSHSKLRFDQIVFKKAYIKDRYRKNMPMTVFHTPFSKFLVLYDFYSTDSYRFVENFNNEEEKELFEWIYKLILKNYESLY